ncbi:MAG: cobalamin-dependent protein, partial [Acidimicrobiales bacterium]|nr:cobalamin-dependent protein [Acidimicrobiales bacterium]
NIMRRILQSQGVEVIHLGHNRSVDEVVTAAVQEDVQGVAISSYQGGHVEYFKYLVDLLRERGAGHVKVFGGGGGVIVPAEIDELHAYGVARIFSPQDGQALGLPGMINTLVAAADVSLADDVPTDLHGLFGGDDASLARIITALECDTLPSVMRAEVRAAAEARAVPVLGITGTGGSGKSSLTDELVRRFRLDNGDKLKIAVIAVDPTRRRGGGALLGDRIRMNSIEPGIVYFRSLATRTAATVPEAIDDIVAATKAWGADVVFVETPGIGQGDDAIVEHVDTSLYVMTPEFGAASQLEKIGMLDFADVVAINKFDRRGGHDALRDVGRQLVRNREAFGQGPDDMPVYGTVASRFNDDGVTALYGELKRRLAEQGLNTPDAGLLTPVTTKASSSDTAIVPPARVRYLSEIAESVRSHHAKVDEQVAVARRRQQLRAVEEMVTAGGGDPAAAKLPELIATAEADLDAEARALLDGWPRTVEDYSGDEHTVTVRGRDITTRLTKESLSGTHVPRVALPRFGDDGELVRFLMEENLPGRFPFTAGVFAFKRDGERPARMFAGEGDAFRTNRRFHLLSEGQPATRLSTAFDSVTL